MDKGKPLIEFVNIVKTYQIGHVQTTVLNNVTLNVNSGEMVAVVGASGSGKSTLMNLIGLLDKATHGEYRLGGLSVAGLTNDELAVLRNRSIGFVFQQFNLLPRFNALYNVALPLLYRNYSTPRALKCAAEVLDRLSMLPFANHRPAQLSGGQQQRIAIARALVGSPKVILADEPTGALDSNTSSEIMSIFHDLHSEGCTLILVTHDEHIACQCTKRITLVDGKTIASVC